MNYSRRGHDRAAGGGKAVQRDADGFAEED